MTPVVLFRMTSYEDEPELEACKRHFTTYATRTAVLPNSLVIPRYSALPFFKELETDLHALGSKPINSLFQHSYVANLGHWYPDFESITPKTWFSLYEAGKASKGPFVLKGETNSRKFSWHTHMFAKDFTAAGEVYSRLSEDGLIGTQSIVTREYVPLRNHGVMPSGIPISHEFRCFFYKNELLTKYFYWANEDVDAEDNVPDSFMLEVGARGGPNVNFWVADVAQTQAGDWIVVELNDGCMSGLSSTPPEVLYSRLKEAL